MRTEKRRGTARGPATALAVALLLVGGRPSAAAEGPAAASPPLPAAWSVSTSGGAVDEADAATLARWWEVLNDPLLSELEQRAVGGSLDLRAAEARLREALARRGAAKAERLPDVGFSGQASRTDTPDIDGSRYSLGATASWEADLFGQQRNAHRAASASAQASEEALRDARVSLAAEVALAYVDVRVSQKRLATAEANIGLLDETLEIAGWRHQAGLVTELDVEQARLQVEQARAALPALRSTLEQARNRVAVLLGQAPGALDAELDVPGAVPVAPVTVAAGVPADVLRRRPDVRRAERELAAQVFRVKSTKASRWPQLSLGGSIGLESLTAGNLLSAAARVITGSLGLGGTLFDFGRVRQQVAIQTAVREQAAIAYEAAVLGAVEEVENALVAYVEEEARRRSLAEASALARSVAELATTRYQAGLVDFQVVLEAQRSLLTVDDQLVSSSGNVASDLVRLYRALGGGWTPGSAA